MAILLKNDLKMGGFITTDTSHIEDASTSFLIVCLRLIGDVLVTTPLAFSIKSHLPNARVDYLVFEGTEGILAKNPYVDKVITMPRSSRSPALIASLWRKYDIALSTNPSDRMTVFSAIAGKKTYGMLNNAQTAQKRWWKKFLLDGYTLYDHNIHAVQLMLSVLDLLNIPKRPQMVIGYDADDVNFVHEMLSGGPYVILHPYSRGAYKYWGAEKWAKLARMIHTQLKLRPIFSVTPDAADNIFLNKIAELAPNQIERFNGSFSFNQLAAALNECAAYIGIDTSVTHIAAAVNAPVIALYGPTLTKYWAPWPNNSDEMSPFAPNKGVQRNRNVTVVQKDWECVPCNQESCAISRRGKMECLEQLSVEEVFNELYNSINIKRTK